MAEENLKLTKTIYSTKSTDGLIDRSFSEFFKTKDPVNLDRFFSVYSELFYDIPKTGDKSHTSIIKQSTDYIKNYIDPRDEQITLLTERIVELEELLNQPTEEHPFFANGTIIAPPTDYDPQEPNGYKMYYMDKGKRRAINDHYEGDVFRALISSLGFPNDATKKQVAKVVPQIIIDGITEGSILDIEDVTGQTAAQQLESQLSVLSDIQVSDWKRELKDLIQPIESETIGAEFQYIELLKQKIKSEFEREGQLESLSWKYYLDATQGFTQEEKENGEKLLALVRPKVIRSRQTLVILKRIWEKKADFPNINFDDILPSTSAVNSNGEFVDDRGSGTQNNPILESDIEELEGWDEGRNLFEGVLTGTDYTVSFNASQLEYKSLDAISLLENNLIRIVYNRYIKSAGSWKQEGTRKKKFNHYETDISRDEMFEVLDAPENRYKFSHYTTDQGGVA